MDGKTYVQSFRLFLIPGPKSADSAESRTGFLKCLFPHASVKLVKILQTVSLQFVTYETLKDGAAGIINELIPAFKEDSPTPIVLLTDSLSCFFVKLVLILMAENPLFRKGSLAISSIVLLNGQSGNIQCIPGDHNSCMYTNIIERKNHLKLHYHQEGKNRQGLLEVLEHHFSLISSQYCFWTISSQNEEFRQRKGLPHFNEIERATNTQDDWESLDRICMWQIVREIGREVHTKTRDLEIQGNNLRIVISRLSRFELPWSLSVPVNDTSMAWVLRDEAYQSWSASKESSCLSVTGSLGSGFSVLSGYILGSLEGAKSTVIRYTFNKENIWQNSTRSLDSSLVYQLLLKIPYLHTRVSPLLAEMATKRFLTEKDILDLLRALLKNIWTDSPLFIIIVNANECEVNRPEVIKIFNAILSTQFIGNACVRLLVLGFEADDLKLVRGNKHELRLLEKEEYGNAVRKMILQKASSLIELNPFWNDFQSSIQEAIYDGKPNFLLAHRRLQLLERPNIRSTRSAIELLLQSPPKTVEESYQRIIDQNPHNEDGWATTALNWLAHAFRPLKQNELAIVLAMQENNIRVETLYDHSPWDVSGDINCIFPGTTRLVRDEVQLYHSSLRTYLIAQYSKSQSTCQASFHQSMLETCLRYLNLVKDDTAIADLMTRDLQHEDMEFFKLCLPPRLSFLEYAIQYWPYHLKEEYEIKRRISLNNAELQGTLPGRDIKCSQEFSSFVINLFKGGDLLSFWSKLHQLFNGSLADLPILNSFPKIAARYGIYDLMRYCLDNERPAAIETAEELKLRFESSKEQEKHPFWAQALDIACQEGYIDIVKLLIHFSVTSEIAIVSAAEAGHEEIVLYLLDDAQSRIMDASSTFIAKLLDKLAENDMKTATEFLVRKRRDILTLDADESQSHIEEILGKIVAHNQIDMLHILRPLITDDSNYQIGNMKLWVRAAERGLTEIAQTLLEFPRSRSLQTKDSAMYAAAANGQLQSVHFFVNSSTPQGVYEGGELEEYRDSLEIASINGHWLVVQELLIKLKKHFVPTRFIQCPPRRDSVPFRTSKGTEPTKQSEQLVPFRLILHAALRYAASSGRPEVVKLLLEAIKDTLNEDTSITETITEDAEGRNALHLAVAHGNETIVGMLLKDGFPSNSTTKHGWAAISYAAAAGLSNLVEILIAENSSVTFFDNKGDTPHHLAVKIGSLPTVKILQKASNNSRLSNEAGETPLWLAIGQENSALLIRELLAKTTARMGTSKYEPRYILLNHAVEVDTLEVVRLLLDNGEDCNVKDSYGYFPLLFATQRYSIEMVDLLLEMGADINMQNRVGETSLWWAIIRKWEEGSKLLISKGANLDKKCDSNRSPLYLAAWYGCTEIVVELLKRAPDGISVNQKNRSGSTALHACYDSAEITDALLKAGADPNIRNDSERTPIFIAAGYSEYLDTAKTLVAGGALITIYDKNNLTPLHIAAESNSLAILKYFVHNVGVNINLRSGNGPTALYCAIDNRYDDTFDFIINETDIDFNLVEVNHGSALTYATSVNSLSRVKALLSRGADVNAYGGNFHSALQAAVATGNKDIIELILQAKPDINAFGGKYGNALLASIIKNIPSITKRLLQQDGIDANFTKKEYATPLEAAAEIGNTEILEMLISKGADINCTAGKYSSALHAAIKGSSLEAVELLLGKGITIKNTIKVQEPPIQAACRAGSGDIVRVLCKYGARLVRRDPNNGTTKSSIDLAIDSNNLGLLIYLLSNKDAEDEKQRIGEAALDKAIKSGKVKEIELIKDAGVNINFRNGELKTPLIIAVIEKRADTVNCLLRLGADANLSDGRQRNALAWAAYIGNTVVFDTILASLSSVSQEIFRDCCRGALYAAIAANETKTVKRLLEIVDQTTRDNNNWLPVQIARSFQFHKIENLMSKSAFLGDITSAELHPPTHWHEYDKAQIMRLSEDKRTIFLNNKEDAPSLHPVARANFCVPLSSNLGEKSEIFYFEITIKGKDRIKNLSGRVISIGFCGEYANLDGFLGWRENSWGFHSDDGKVYGNGASTGKIYGTGFGIDSVIGCGINLRQQLAFFTLNGKFLGVAFEDVRGQVYPAVSMNGSLLGVEISINFGPPEGESFRYNYSPRHLNGEPIPQAYTPGPSSTSTRGTGSEDAEEGDDWW